MTGTPEPIDWLFSDRLKAHKCFNDLNLFDICKHVVPTEIVLGDTASALGDIVNEVLSLNNRVIYFANSITRMERLVPELVKCGIPQEAIGIAYSGEARRDFPEPILNRKREIRDFILEKERIPEDIKVFLTTSQNKEGINLMDEDIHTMYSETCKKSALIQMAGRIRNGLDYLFVIYDAPEHQPVASMEEIEIDKNCLPVVRKYWKESEFDNPREIIQMIEEKFPCIRYDYISQKFRFYSERQHALIQEHEDKELVRRCAYRYGSDYDRYRDDEGELVSHAKESMQEWFPESDIQIQYHLAPWVQMEILENVIDPFLWYYFYDDYGVMTKEDKENLRTNLNWAIEESGIPVEELGIKFPIKQLNPFLKIFRRQIIEAPGMRKGTGYLLVPYAEPARNNKHNAGENKHNIEKD